MQLAIASGKGGTGKTTVALNLAYIASQQGKAVQYLDCDVEKPNGHLFLNPEIEETRSVGMPVPEVDEPKCTGCGLCREICQYNAITCFNKMVLVFPELCHGCGGCTLVCPEKAIEFKETVNGKWFSSDTRFGPMVHAKLGIAEENSGKLVTIVKNEAKKIAQENGHPYMIVDGSPGIGCPVIASLSGANLVVIVTEPTLSGEHDLERVGELARHFNIPAVICANKYDLNPQITDRIKEKSVSCGFHFAGTVRYDKVVTEAQINKTTIVEFSDSPVSEDINILWRNILSVLST